MTNDVSDADLHVTLVGGTKIWWSEFWDQFSDGIVTPLPLGEESKDLSNESDDAVDEIANPPEE